MATVRSEVKDVNIHAMPGIAESESIKNAWELMRNENAQTVPILEEGKLQGLITITDIAKSYMEVHDAHVLANARTEETAF